MFFRNPPIPILRLCLGLSMFVVGLLIGAHAGPALAASKNDDSTWQVRLLAAPDTVGVGGYVCEGCDRKTGDADRLAAASQPLQPLEVLIHRPGDRRTVLWHGFIRRDTWSRADIQRTVTLTVPPPYEVRLITTTPLGYTLCPNAKSTVVLTQASFDVSNMNRAGTGRNAQVGWYFWHCSASDG